MLTDRIDLINAVLIKINFPSRLALLYSKPIAGIPLEPWSDGRAKGCMMRDFFKDPRNPFAVILLFYTALGCTVLGFNRNPLQILTMIGFGCALEVFFAWIFRKPSRLIPKSALITSTSLALLLNYGHSYQLLFFPVFCAIASKSCSIFLKKSVKPKSMCSSCLR